VPKLAITEERQVSEEVRKEQIQVDDQDQLGRQGQRSVDKKARFSTRMKEQHCGS
jgi:hypothetical protein